jgi:CubicO group peptidase (beta-lactamase class C family)/predicted glycoside hydrolase/deacetylase ChbG (UPF0249 family)
MRSILLCLLLALTISPAPAQTRRQVGASTLPADSSRTLPRSSPERQGISSSAILAFIEAADREIDQMHSFMLLRHGRVVAEGWWGPYDAQTPHILYSLSKSFTSTAVGLVIAEGKISLDDEVLKFFPEDAPAEPSTNLRSMRVRDLLRMNTGHQTEAPLWRGDQGTQNDPWTKKFLAHPVPFKPGTHFLYNSPATYMLSAIVQKVTGMTVLDYLRPRLFEPLGIENPTWVASPQGITVGAYGLLARTEDIARFGQLYLQKGVWKGRQLIPAAWVEEATARQTSNGSSPQSDWDQGYGYQFWRSRHNSFRGDGAFGQYCLVIPELDAVVAITSGVRNMQAVMNLVWEKLLPAMKAKPLPEDPAARRQLEAKLAGLQVRLPSGKPASPLAARVSGRWYEFPANDRGIQAAALDFNSASPALVVRAAGGETRTAIGSGSWTKSRDGFINGIDRFLSVPARPVVAASGAWTADDVYTVKIVPFESPFYSTMAFRFDGDRLLLDSEHNVAFGPTKLPQLVGQASSVKSAQKEGEPVREGEIRLLVRADDMGVAQAVNEACIKSHQEGIVKSVEVIVPGPWFLDAVRLLKENPGLDVGVHLALTSEWERVKWRPLTAAPSLVDANGYFHPTTRQRPDFPPGTGFLDASPKLEEVERELRAQIETAQRHLGKRVSHVSSHMATATSTPELRALTERLAKEYGLRMEITELKFAGMFGNSTFTGDQRENALVDLVEKLQPGQWMILEHPAFDTPEMRQIGHPGYENVAADRAGVTRAFTSARVKEAIARRKIKLISYADIAPTSR